MMRKLRPKLEKVLVQDQIARHLQSSNETELIIFVDYSFFLSKIMVICSLCSPSPHI